MSHTLFLILSIITITITSIHAAPIRPSILQDDIDTPLSTSTESVWRTHQHLQHIQQYLPSTPKHASSKLSVLAAQTSGAIHILDDITTPIITSSQQDGINLDQQSHINNIRTDQDPDTIVVADPETAHSDVQGSAAVVPVPVFAVGMSASGMSVSGSGGVSVAVSPVGATGVSVVTDSVRSYCLRRSPSSAFPSSGVAVSGSGSSLSASYTKSVWVSLSSYGSYPQFMSGASASDEVGAHWLGLGATSTIYAGHANTAGGRFDISDDAAGTFPLNTWTHIAVTYQGTTSPYTLTIYRNGKQTASRTSTQQSWAGGKATQIGNWNNYGMDACVDDATQWNVALSAAEIDALYQSQLPGATPAPSTQAPTAAPTAAPTSAPTSSVSSNSNLPVPVFAVQTSSAGMSVSGSGSVSVAVSPSAAAGVSVSVLADSVRGYCLRRSPSSLYPSAAVITSGIGSTLSQSYTKAVWVSVSSYGSYPQFMSAITTADEVGAHWLGLGATSTVYAAHTNTAGGRFDISDDAAGTFPLNTWTHIAVTYQGDVAPYTLTIYRNGVATASRTSTQQTWTGGRATQIGNWNNYGMDACVTDATQYATALTAAQISTLYQSQVIASKPTQATAAPPAVTPAPATPVPVTTAPVTATPTAAPSVVPAFQQSSGVGGSNGIGFTYGRTVMTGAVKVYLIYYGSWTTSSPAYTQLPQFVDALGGSAWWNTGTTYYQQADATSTRYYLNNDISMAGKTIRPLDASLANSAGGTTIADSQVYSIITAAIASGAMGSTVVDPQAMYMLITSAEVKLPSGFCTGYCGWHTQSSYGGRTLRYGTVGDASTQCPSACGANRGVSINGDLGSDNMANILAHELMETATDPGLNIWKTSTNQENADMCAWQFGTTYTTPTGARANMKLRNGRDYLVQMNWLNHNGGKCAITV